MNVLLIVVIVIAILVLVALARTVRVVPQGTAGVVERGGHYHRTLGAGLNVVLPFIDRMRPLIDLREQVVSFPPQPVITEDKLVVSIDTVVYFNVDDPRTASYGGANFITGMEQLTVTTLRNVISGLDLDSVLTSRDDINRRLRAALEEKAADWGVRVNRAELKAIDPPPSIQESMEKQTRAERDKRAAILTAEGEKQSAILTAEGERQGAVLRARGEAEAAVLKAKGDAEAQSVRARGQAEAIATVFRAIHQGKPDNQLLAYQYIQMLPEIAQGDSNKVWIVPSEMGKALEGLGGLFDVAKGTSGEPPAEADGSHRKKE
ncbi:MAG: SPFH domain-containing protein [Streptosporangiaceae bacterium]